jgi:hypothetical protein
MKNDNKTINKICTEMIFCLGVIGKNFGSSKEIPSDYSTEILKNRFQTVSKNYSPLEDLIPLAKDEDITLIETAIRLTYKRTNGDYGILWDDIRNEEVQYLGRSFSVCFNRFNDLQKCFTKTFGRDIIHDFHTWLKTHPGSTVREFLQEPIRNPQNPQGNISRIKLIRQRMPQ